MNFKHVVMILFVCTHFFACNSDEELTDYKTSDYLIFGHFHGECLGESCVENYMLFDSKVFEDTLDLYRQDEFQFVELKGIKFKTVSHLIKEFPDELKSIKDSTFGCPDCADGGGLRIELQEDGVMRRWYFEKNPKEVSIEIIEYCEAIKSAIKELK